MRPEWTKIRLAIRAKFSELEPGKWGSLTVTLPPGKYLLICNLPGHYGAGMSTEFAVTK